MTDTLNIVYFPAALALGALHALEPGHAKALTASYLIGIKGTKRDSVVLGLSVATTHSLVVILISAIGLWLGNAAFTGKATEWLERGSGLVAIGIGCWMLWRRIYLRSRNHVGDHHHRADPISIDGQMLKGMLEIVETPLGEKMRFSSSRDIDQCELLVEIDRDNGRVEILHINKSPDNKGVFLSMETPSEPHEFNARLIWLDKYNGREEFAFSMKEPEGHSHHENHDHLDDVAHAKAHAETLPEYTKTGEKPSLKQIMLFGAAGGMIPCPASITVMLLALSTGKAAMGIFTVLGFSLGLAVSLVGVGVIVVTGLSKLSETGRFSWITRQAPLVSASLVVVSGIFAVTLAHKP
jgi:nickel/cobalt exporter